MNENHITKEQLNAYHTATLSPQEEAVMLKHIAGCDFCSGLFAESFHCGPMLMAPRELKYNVLAASQRPNTQLSVRTNKLSRQLQLTLYSLKVSAAVCASLLVLAVTPQAAFGPVSPITAPIYESRPGITGWFHNQSQQIGDLLNQISNQILSSEDYNYD